MGTLERVVEGSEYLWIGLTLWAYLAGLFLNRRLKSPLAHPLLIGIGLLIGALHFLRADYARYVEAVRPLTLLLTPATVCLAVPLYRQLPLLRRHAGAILIGVLMGVLSNMATLLALGSLFGLTPSQFATLLPKSVTTAIGMGLAVDMGGSAPIAFAGILVSGIFGNLVASKVCSMFRIEEPLAVGLAIGTAAHAIGTVRALEIGETEGAMSGLAIALTGLLTVGGAPFFMRLVS